MKPRTIGCTFTFVSAQFSVCYMYITLRNFGQLHAEYVEQWVCALVHSLIKGHEAQNM